MTPSGERWGPVECADLLNQQAETIEVLRGWAIEGCGSVYHERRVIEMAGRFPAERVELAKRRIAALEGE